MKKALLILLGGMIFAPTLAWGLSSTVYRYMGNYGIATTTPAYTLDVYGNSRVDGTLKVGDYTLPSTDGTADYVLKTDGSGALTWSADNDTGGASSIAELNAQFTDESVASTTQIWDFSDYTNATAGTGITFTDDAISVTDNYLLNTGDIGTGVYDFGGATSLEIPNGATCTADTLGEICLDSTDDQLIAYGASEKPIQTKVRIWGATIASTTPAFIDGGLLKVPTNLDGYTMTNIRCSVQGGTSKVIAIEDESANSTEDITCATSVTSDDGSITNATVTAGEEMYIDFGATTDAVDYVSISVFGTWTRE